MKNNTQQTPISPKMAMYMNAMKNKHNQHPLLSEQLQKNQSLAQFHEQQQSQRSQEQGKQDNLRANSSFRSLKFQDLNVTHNPIDVIKLKDILDGNRKEIKVKQQQSQVQHKNQQQKSFTSQKHCQDEVFAEQQKGEKKLNLPIQDCKQKFKENVNLDLETPRFFGMP
ncbi:unnamed protein product (macronuclear) [Paramecium tetraurelia]|uniref:Uncharacterized protein n=1 Tax=Paramecium tetraurelia TaxID=5888 RepID=A0BJC5_PARTE|nr:uncharacterized protein GSPATT00005015001 [Paramecium tetraurelia]CAK58642.1 unnamed protein product [Paramecium tetraurelia]|eukprot:XP_001426040.1 hypothetical protein (macronuclear) [Paramecium tetraurelia strain d4-2]